MEIKTGEIWRVSTRSFDGIIKVLEDIKDTDEDVFFKAEIFEGKTHYLNKEDLGKGEEISLRTSLTRWRNQEGPTEADKAGVNHPAELGEI